VVILFEIYGIDDSAFIVIVFFGYYKCKYFSALFQYFGKSP